MLEQPGRKGSPLLLLKRGIKPFLRVLFEKVLKQLKIDVIRGLRFLHELLKNRCEKKKLRKKHKRVLVLERKAET